MNKTDFRRLFRYSDNCWTLLGETLMTHPHASEIWNTPFETTSQWNTVRLLLVHSIGAEERLVAMRLQNQGLSAPYEERAALDWADLYRDYQSVRGATYAYLDSLTDAAVEDETEACRIAGVPLTRADALFHILNHENYHRGQAVMALQRLGVDPPNFDYVFLKAV